MNAKDIHEYIKSVAFDKISLASVQNILKKFVRKGYMESYEEGDEVIYKKIAEDIVGK